MFTKMLLGAAIALGAVVGAAPAGAIPNAHAAGLVTIDNRVALAPMPAPPPPAPPPVIAPPPPPPAQAPAPDDSDWWPLPFIAGGGPGG